MDSQSPARWMAPLALLVALVAVGAIIASTTGGDEAPTAAPTSTASSTSTSEQPATSTGEDADEPAQTTPSTTETDASGPSTYTVESGDTLGSIAASTGVSVEELQELNPDLDPQALTVGDTVRLRR